MKQYIAPLLGLGVLVLLLTTIYKQNKVINEYKTKASVKYSDSLQTELFISQSEVGRYEMTLEIYKDANPKAVEEIELIKSTQTD